MKNFRNYDFWICGEALEVSSQSFFAYSHGHDVARTSLTSAANPTYVAEIGPMAMFSSVSDTPKLHSSVHKSVSKSGPSDSLNISYPISTFAA